MSLTSAWKQYQVPILGGAVLLIVLIFVLRQCTGRIDPLRQAREWYFDLETGQLSPRGIMTPSPDGSWVRARIYACDGCDNLSSVRTAGFLEADGILDGDPERGGMIRPGSPDDPNTQLLRAALPPMDSPAPSLVWYAAESGRGLGFEQNLNLGCEEPILCQPQ
jgi:hypothetical protein